MSDAATFDDKVVKIVRGEFAGFVGRAMDVQENGWLSVSLDEFDPEDDRWLFPVMPDDVELYEREG